MDQFEVIDIKNTDKNTFFHYTNIHNLDSISKNGLEPRIGDNAIGIEENKKIFFTIGITNSLILMESWIKWLIAKSPTDFPGKRLDGPVYKIATIMLKIKFLQPLITLFVRWELSTKYKRISAYKKLKKILDESVYLSLDLKEGVDFSFSDMDEVKGNTFDRALLKYLYSYKSNVDDFNMEYWNMHTTANKMIEKEKIKMIKVGDSTNASDILEYMRKNSDIKIKKDLPYLYGYFQWIETQNKNTRGDI